MGDHELVGQPGHPAVGCAGKEVMFSFTVHHHPYVTTAVMAHHMYARHSVFRACISLVVWGARPRLEVAMCIASINASLTFSSKPSLERSERVG